MESTKSKATETQEEISPANIMQVGMGFWASKVLLAAVNFDLFTFLSAGPKPAADIRYNLNLQERGFFDFMDALVALGFLNRKGIKETAVYSNTADTDIYLDRHKPTYLGGLLVMANNRLYKFWGNLEEALKTGKPQNETKESGNVLFEDLYADQQRLREFLEAMKGVQMGNFKMFAQQFDFSRYKTLCDIGGAGGYLAAMVAMFQPHMKCTTFDLPQVEPIAKENIARMKLMERVKVQTGDFFKDDFPKADVITMGNILHDWGLKDKKMLLKKAFAALPPGGAFVAIENVIDNDRSANAFGLMSSLNMLIETDEGFDYTAADFEKWAKEAGFTKVDLIPLTGPSSAVIAMK